MKSNVDSNLIIVVVGNKIDLAKHRVITDRAGKQARNVQIFVVFASVNAQLTFVWIQYADSIGALFFETSARENSGIEQLFLEVCACCVRANVCDYVSSHSADASADLQEASRDRT